MDDQTVWVVPLFGLASLGFTAIAPSLAVPSGSGWRLAREIGVMTAVYGTSGWVGADHPLAVTAAFAALFTVRLALSRDRGTLAALAILLAVAGPAFESLQWVLGMFAYTRPDIMGVPWWLFAFYANAAWGTRELGALLTHRTADSVRAG